MKKSIVDDCRFGTFSSEFRSKAAKSQKFLRQSTAREKGDLALAKEIIDQATTYEKTKDDGKTWYYRGLIYATLDTTSNPQYATLSENALTIAMESFKKSDELADGKEYYITGANWFTNA